ncbi:LexA-binding, inner membrane-associated putative hydrolase [Marinactinospora thermotolerans DSM 45154]|uniref:LexA-binding, inner membrane-associated putative hydrolase n=1 Tax=Marinactinospora thermotolerans DSM 45154 TaxID=1122192 RepID=A0A1T4K787_9ACTN|nr:metal-dependent hydrolase [Marinactinospora thermotolerans]SJZ38207.1 LexA-binding, inner membrane-associated putative hydrolase [Marinactinospora thermotolerans DSM 45154]
MMGASHAATGAFAGLAASAAVTALGGASPDGWTLVGGALVGAGAALVPDLDHPDSTATRSQGPFTRWLSTGVRALSAQVYLATRTRWDRSSDGTHRYLFHTPACALALGLIVGVTAALWWQVAAVVVWFTLSLALRGLGRCLPAGPARTAVTSWLGLFGPRRRGGGMLRPATRYRLVEWASVSIGAALLTALLFNAGSHLAGAPVGAALALGMIVHVLGDALTRSAVPLAWPVAVKGQRWRMVGAPRSLRFSTGSWQEVVIRVVCLAGTPLLGLAVL